VFSQNIQPKFPGPLTSWTTGVLVSLPGGIHFVRYFGPQDVGTWNYEPQLMPHCPSESMEAPPVSWSALGCLDLLGECMLGIWTWRVVQSRMGLGTIWETENHAKNNLRYFPLQVLMTTKTASVHLRLCLQFCFFIGQIAWAGASSDLVG
jgi:hypothetical protein